MTHFHVVSTSGGKACSRCGVWKPYSEFSADRKRPDGKQYTCKSCYRSYHKEQRAKHRAEGKLTYSQKNYRRLRMEVMSHYAGGAPSCACCGEATFEFLSIDHVDGGGAEHRRNLAAQGTILYRWIKREGFPPGFRVLCHNCNQALGTWGYCPHQNQARPEMPPLQYKLGDGGGCSSSYGLCE